MRGENYYYRLASGVFRLLGMAVALTQVDEFKAETHRQNVCEISNGFGSDPKMIPACFLSRLGEEGLGCFLDVSEVLREPSPSHQAL